MSDSWDSVDDEVLLAAAARGEREAFGVFYRRHLARGRAEQRARRRLGIARDTVGDEDLERVDELVGGSGRLLGLLGDLPETQRLAVQARVIEERDYDEIASASGVSQAVVRQRVKRGLAWLRARSSKEDQT